MTGNLESRWVPCLPPRGVGFPRGSGHAYRRLVLCGCAERLRERPAPCRFWCGPFLLDHHQQEAELDAPFFSSVRSAFHPLRTFPEAA